MIRLWGIWRSLCRRGGCIREGWGRIGGIWGEIGVGVVWRMCIRASSKDADKPIKNSYKAKP
jgi:hypothetical protein